MIEAVVNIGLLKIRQQRHKSIGIHDDVIARRVGRHAVPAASGWVAFETALIVMKRQRQLLQVVGTLHTPGCFASCLHSREQQPTRIPIIAITTRSSTSVKPCRDERTRCDLAQRNRQAMTRSFMNRERKYFRQATIEPWVIQQLRMLNFSMSAID